MSSTTTAIPTTTNLPSLTPPTCHSLLLHLHSHFLDHTPFPDVLIHIVLEYCGPLFPLRCVIGISDTSPQTKSLVFSLLGRPPSVPSPSSAESKQPSLPWYTTNDHDYPNTDGITVLYKGHSLHPHSFVGINGNRGGCEFHGILNTPPLMKPMLGSDYARGEGDALLWDPVGTSWCKYCDYDGIVYLYDNTPGFHINLEAPDHMNLSVTNTLERMANSDIQGCREERKVPWRQDGVGEGHKYPVGIIFKEYEAYTDKDIWASSTTRWSTIKGGEPGVNSYPNDMPPRVVPHGIERDRTTRTGTPRKQYFKLPSSTSTTGTTANTNDSAMLDTVLEWQQDVLLSQWYHGRLHNDKHFPSPSGRHTNKSSKLNKKFREFNEENIKRKLPLFSDNPWVGTTQRQREILHEKGALKRARVPVGGLQLFNVSDQFDAGQVNIMGNIPLHTQGQLGKNEGRSNVGKIFSRKH